MKDIVIIGAGPAGLFAAFELISGNPKLNITLLDKGFLACNRQCPMNEKKIPCVNCNPCNIMAGFGGAGTFSDGKLNFIPKLGKSNLYKYMSISEAEELIDYTESIFTKFGMDSDVYPSNMDEALKIKEKVATCGANMLVIKQKHLGSDNLPKYISDFTEYLKINAVIINNCFAGASKRELLELRNHWDKLNDYALDNYYGAVACYIFDGTVRAASSDSIIITFDDDENFDKLLTPSPKSNLPSFSEILAIAEQNRFDLKIAQKEIEVAKNNLKIATDQRMPDLEISAGYLYQPIGMSGEGKFLNGAYAGANLVNLPILYNYSPEINNAKLEIQKAQLKYAAAQNNAFANLSSAYEKLINARVNLNYYTDSLIENSKTMMRTSKKNYEDGKADLTTLIVIEQSYRSIIVGYTYALSQYYSCWINFLREVDVEKFDQTANL